MIELDLRNRATPGNSRIPIIGIGGAGANALDRLALDGVAPANLIAVNSDAQALTASVAGEKIQLGASATHGLGTGGDPELGRCAAEESAAELRSSLEGNDAVILVAGLGGGTGSGALPLAAELAREAGALVIAVVTLPFGFEGKRRAAQAAEALAELQEHADAVICFENDRMGETVPARSGIQSAFAAAHQTLSQCIQAITAILHGSEGLLPLGLDDLSTVLQDVNAHCLFGHGQAEGNNRSFDALSRALKNPLMDKGRLLRDCDTVLVRVAGGPDLTLDEVQLLMEEFNRYVNDHTRVLLGTSVEPALAGKVAVSILSSVSDGRRAAAVRPIRKSLSERPAVALAAKPAPIQAELEPEPEPEPELLEVEAEAADEEPLEVVEPIVSVETEALEAVVPDEASEAAEAPDEVEEEDESFELEPTGADEAGLPVVHAEEEEPEIPAPAPAPRAAERRLAKPRGLRAATYQGSLFGDEPAAPIERVAPPVPGRMLRRPFPEPEPAPEPVSEAPVPAPVYRRAPVTPTSAPVPTPAPTVPASAPVAPQSTQRLAARRPEPVPAPEPEFEPEPELEPVTEPEVPEEPEASISEVPEPEPEPMPESQPAAPALRQRPAIRRMERRPAAPHAPELVPGEEARPATSASRAPQQEVMQFEPVTRGRFEKSEPTIVDGQDLDVPTYLRRRLKLR